MSEAGEDWAGRSAAAAEDAGLASFAAGGALFVWDPAAERPHPANAAAEALLGGRPNLPAPTRQRLNLLAQGLASLDGIRLERLRLTASFAAVPATCGCKLVALPGGQAVLALAVQASELRRLGIAVPPAPPAAPARPATIRFLWQSDRDGRLTRLSETISALAGESASAGLIGQSWQDLLGQAVIDSDGGLIERFASPATWSGHRVLWRTETPGEAVPVELSGVPVLDAGRQLSGFRGFGMARLNERLPFPEAEAEEPVVADEDISDAPGPDELSHQPEEEAEEIAASPSADEPPETETETAESAPEAPEPDLPPGRIVPLRNGHPTAIRPVLEPSKSHLSSAERNAFREIAKALGARLTDDEEPGGPRLPPVAPLQVREKQVPPAEVEAAVPARQRNSHAEVLDRLPVAVLVNRDDEALYANRTLLELLDYADLADLKAGGNVSRLIKDAARTDGGAMTLIDRLGHPIGVDAVLSSVNWQDEPATLMAFRQSRDDCRTVPPATPEEAEEAELAAEFAAEEAESAARVEALRLDAEARDARIAELTAMLDTATDGVVTVDDRGRILSLNKAAEALFGYDQREVTGELFTLLFASESHAPALDYLEGLKGGGVASVMNDGREVQGRVRQGGRIALFMTMGQIAHGAEPRFCAVLRDLTAWKKTEGELVEARKAAEIASAQKSDVLAKISHEIRTPLNAIIGFAEVMAEERFGPIANERYKEYLRDIHQSGGYVISLVNDLLDLAKIEAGKLDLDFVSVNLNEIALSTVSLLQPEAQRGRVVLRSGLSPKLPPVVADERSIRQIAINLISNAVKFTDAGGQVIISTALGDQGEAILRVRDTGIGMDDDELKLALEPFRQVPATRRAGGTGLGLPLTKALVEANRAAMAITSVKKEGTLVEITFPPQRVLAS
ncbi:ATP-binding protein [Bosea sp. (in: a-proteobacteria)]|uniref:ATP-binding protein n=1 Tax=Bosea sp. (in: a-proteobacteria) TaxID=1871050 RepID=UPI002614A2DC|nr:ATP-binding protein [Bosea sp. (in: a-proteobacteria)]MCO5092388.1 PAS domain S-box protein [Bosea sp. (in: a-proteobacteria)]